MYLCTRSTKKTVQRGKRFTFNSCYIFPTLVTKDVSYGRLRTRWGVHDGAQASVAFKNSHSRRRVGQATYGEIWGWGVCIFQTQPNPKSQTQLFIFGSLQKPDFFLADVHDGSHMLDVYNSGTIAWVSASRASCTHTRPKTLAMLPCLNKCSGDGTPRSFWLGWPNLCWYEHIQTPGEQCLTRTPSCLCLVMSAGRDQVEGSFLSPPPSHTSPKPRVGKMSRRNYCLSSAPQSSPSRNRVEAGQPRVAPYVCF